MLAALTDDSNHYLSVSRERERLECPVGIAPVAQAPGSPGVDPQFRKKPENPRAARGT
jgi:hypothetical protein